jgi:hypothetical protein
MKKLRLKPISNVKNRSEAQSIAMDFKEWSSENSLSWGEIAKYNQYFMTLGKKFKLTKEFKENGII